MLPTIATTFLITLFFGLFGLIPAITHTSRARQMGQPTDKYWTTFIIVFLVQLIFFAILIATGSR